MEDAPGLRALEPRPAGLSGPVLPPDFLVHWSRLHGRRTQGAVSARGKRPCGPCVTSFSLHSHKAECSQLLSKLHQGIRVSFLLLFLVVGSWFLVKKYYKRHVAPS